MPIVSDVIVCTILCCNTIFAHLSLETPDAPRNLEVMEVTHNSITVEWQPPRNDGGARVTGYILERRQGFSSRFSQVDGIIHDTFFRDNQVRDR